MAPVLPGRRYLRRGSRDLVTYVLYTALICAVFLVIIWWQCGTAQPACSKQFIDAQCAAKAADAAVLEHPLLTEKPRGATYLAIVILSAPLDASLRMTIRQTWLTLSSKGSKVFQHFFPLGIQSLQQSALTVLRRENDTYGDLLFLDNLEEAYSNLPKKVLYSFAAVHSLLEFEYLLKVDSDSFVRLGSLLRALRDVEHSMLYWGFLDGRARVKKTGRWADGSWKLCDRYLPYALGGGYVLSRPLIRYLTDNRSLLKLFNNEDVSVGAWLAGLDVRYVHEARFDTEYKSRGCSNQYIITHKKSETEIRNLYDTLRSRGVLCAREYRDRGSYVYDWSVVPSQCCVRSNSSKIP